MPVALGTPDATAVSAATDAANSLKDTGVAVVVALIPLAAGFFLVKKAWPLAQRMLKI